MKVRAGYHFRRVPAEAPAPEAWRMLDRTVARWVAAHGGSPLLATLAGWASHADGQGDSALTLTGESAARHGMAPLDAQALAQLTGEPMVLVIDPAAADSRGEEADPPFVIEDGYFYLRRNHLHEAAVALHVRQRRACARTVAAISEADIDVLFQGDADERVQAQRAAVAQAPGKRLFVLTGGPGTGKTTTVLRMLMLLLKHRAESGDERAVIRIAAPTGKAAQRLSESLREGANRMGEGTATLPAEWQPYLDATLAAHASTLHRLLGSRGHRGGFVHHAGNPVPADIVIIDEASMVDLAMLRNLLDALREDAALILVGDADQLTSVGTGSVLLDLVGAMESDGNSDLVRLSHSFRADQSLLPVNEAVRVGDPDAFVAACDAAGAAVRRIPAGTIAELRAALVRWAQGLGASLEQAGAFDHLPPDTDAAQYAALTALDGLRERQLLCALREGEFGAEAANYQLEGLVRRGAIRDGLAGQEGEWYPGRAVMITRNDYTAGLFNGDVGVCLRDADGALGVWFEVTVQPDAASAGAERSDVEQPAKRRHAVRFSPGGLPYHQGAFAITIHKSQGSEYRHVAVLLPPEQDNRVLSRQLLYTGLSRARQGVEIWAEDGALERAITTPARRWSGLRRKLTVGAS